jgi:hypothetical protein
MQKPMAGAVAAAVASLELAAANGRAQRTEDEHSISFSSPAKHPDLMRHLTVDIKVEARCADDSLLAPLVIEALREFIAASPAELQGKFESTAGLDVSWSVHNQYFDAAGRLVEMEVKTQGVVLQPGEQA